MDKSAAKKKDGPIMTPEQEEAFLYSLRHPAFTSYISFELEMTMFAEKVNRQARVNFRLTPEWPYWDSHLNREHVSAELFSWDFEVLAVPEFGTKTERKPRWTPLGILEPGIIPQSVVESIRELADEECKKLDKARREIHVDVEKPPGRLRSRSASRRSADI